LLPTAILLLNFKSVVSGLFAGLFLALLNDRAAAAGAGTVWLFPGGAAVVLFDDLETVADRGCVAVAAFDWG
jgi:hypothetical protein